MLVKTVCLFTLSCRCIVAVCLVWNVQFKKFNNFCICLVVLVLFSAPHKNTGMFSNGPLF